MSWAIKDSRGADAAEQELATTSREANSPIMTTGPLVLAKGIAGMTETSRDAQALDALDAQLEVHNRSLVRPHRASADRMK